MIDQQPRKPLQATSPPNHPNSTLPYVKLRTTVGLHAGADMSRPENNPALRHMVAYDLAGANEIALLFRSNPSVIVLISPTEMVFRADWLKLK